MAQRRLHTLAARPWLTLARHDPRTGAHGRFRRLLFPQEDKPSHAGRDWLCGLGLWMAGVLGSPPSTGRYSGAFIRVIGWAAVVFFGLSLVVSFRRLLSLREVLRVGYAGIRSTQWSDRVIPWGEIVDVTLWTHRGQTVIVLHLQDATRFPGRGLAGLMAPANRLMTGGDISISLTGANRTVDEALSAMAEFKPSRPST